MAAIPESHHNQLTDIVAGNKNELLLLDLSHNKLTSLHNDLFPNLNTLLINNNLLSEIKIFYSNFCNVQTLNAANNQLKYINLDFLTYLPSIKSLRLDNNKITHIDTNNTSDIGTLFPIIKQRNIKVKNMTLDEINNTYCNNDYYNQAIREEPIDLLDRSFSSSSWPF